MLSRTPVPFAVSAGTTQATSGTVIFSNSNGVTFGLNGNTVTASVAVGGGNINISAGTTSNNLTNFVLSNSNGLTFGLDGSTVTGSHNGLTSQSNQNVTAANGGFAFQTLSFSNLNGISFGTSAGSAITASHNGLTSQSNQAFSADGGSSAFQTLNFRNANGISFSNSDGSVQASYTVPTVPAQFSGGLSNIGNTVGDTGVVTGRVVFAGGNNVTLSGSTDGGSATVTISAFNQTVQSAIQGLGASNTGNTAGNTGISTGINWVLAGSNNITISQSTVGGGPNTLWVSGPTVGGAQTGISGIQVSDTTYTSGTVTFQNANGISFGSSGANGISASYTVPSTAGLLSNIRVSAGTTSNLLSAVTFANGNGVSFGLDASTITASHNGLTSQSNQNVTAANGGFAFQTLSFSNANNFSFGTSAGSAITGSYTAPVVSNAMQAVGSVTVSGTNTSRFAADDHVHAGVAAFGASNTGNTAGNTGTQFGTWVLAGTNNVTVSGSTGAGGVHTLWLSAPTPGAGGAVNVSAGTTSNDLTQIVFSNSNNMTFGLNGSTITASFNAINLGVSTMGNTAGTTGTIEGNGGQYLLVGSNGVFLSQSTNGASSGTLTINGWPHISSYENLIPYSNNAITWNGASISHAVAFQVPQALSASFMRVPILQTTATAAVASVVAGAANASAERYSTFHAVVYSIGTGASSRSLISVASGSGGVTMRNSISVSNSSRYSITQQYTCGVEGGTTTASTQYSQSALSATFSTGFLTAFTGSRFLDIQFANSLSPGPYWAVVGYRSSTATNSTMVSAGTACGVHYSAHMGLTRPNTNWGIMGSSNLTSGGLLGAGSFSTNTNTTTSAFPMSAISSSGSNNAMYFQLLRSA